ncbi:hypothetical protein QTP86_012867 [Hemibagrus guttatus]|nr:hypothetical protein QTP86_012867 [Hemibagrus guttatus]
MGTSRHFLRARRRSLLYPLPEQMTVSSSLETSLRQLLRFTLEPELLRARASESENLLTLISEEQHCLKRTGSGKMDKRKDLSEFDKGQIVMARPLDQSISKTAALVGCSRSAVVSIYQKWSKEGTLVTRRQGHGRPRLIDARGE